MSRRNFPWLLSGVALISLALGGARDARAAAGANDKEVEALIESVITGDYVTDKFDAALEHLKLGEQACEAPAACSPKMRARLYIAIGTVFAGGLKKPDEAKEAFTHALKEDATASLFSDFITPDIEQSFNDARNAGSASGGSQETQAATAGDRKPKKKWPGTGRPPRGWKSAEAYFYYSEARKAESSQEWIDCFTYAQASLVAENRPSTRFQSASCEERSGLWIEAYADYQTVVDTAGRAGMQEVAAQAKQQAQILKDKIPKIVIRKPATAEGLIVRMNDVEVPDDKLGGEIWINPGQRTVKAVAKVDGSEKEFAQVIDAAEFETATVDLKFEAGSAGAKEVTGGDPTIMRCFLAAKSRDEYAKCLGNEGGSSINTHLGMEVMGYHDTDHTDVISPAWSFGLDSPTAGWGVGAAFVLDVVTAASTDIVATASPRWREYRFAPGINGHKKFGKFGDVALNAGMSREPDYLALDGGISLTNDLANKRLTSTLAYGFGYNINGRSGTPFNVYGKTILNHSGSVSGSFVLNKSTVFNTSFTFVGEFGDQSKPYRYIPIFPVGTPVTPGYSIQDVTQTRLALRPLEQLPTVKLRYALAGLLAHRFNSSTIRIEERLYTDSWGMKATTTDINYLVDVGERFRIWPHARFHFQTGVNFYQLAYNAVPDKADPTRYIIPSLRTGDRELGSVMGATLGLSGRYAFGEGKNWALVLTGQAVYSRFFETLYVQDRLGILGVTALEVELE